MSDVKDGGDLFHPHPVTISGADCLISISSQLLLGFLNLALAALKLAGQGFQPVLRLR